jgi:hypothetical protein
MRFLLQSAALSLISCALLSSAWAAENHGKSAGNASNVSHASSPRLLNSDEGLSIIAAALEFRHRNRSKPDCSHFVNSIYEKAGFPYDYANSVELYAGTDSFRRVSRPQPGDLIVWPGHVGIVIHPAQHSFFSVLRSGLGVEDYESSYWRRRGRLRFFRYVRVAAPAVLATDSHPMNVREVASTTGESENATLDGVNEGESTEPEQAVPEVTSIPSPKSTTTASPVVYASKPRPEDVRVVLLRQFNGTEQSLRGQDVFRSEQPVTVFESLDVKKVHLKGNTGWAEVRIEGLSSVAQGQAKVKNASERRRFSLTRRDAASWELIIPREAVYVPREVAVRIFAHQLASLTDHPDPETSSNEKVQLAHLLNVLLQSPTR